MNKKWDTRHMAAARLVATWSKDPSTQVGARIVRGKVMVSEGFNGPPAGFADDASMDRPLKLAVTLHAETNALLFARQDVSGCTIYVTHHPCAQCAAKIAQAGISRVVCPAQDGGFARRWADDLHIAARVLAAAGVAIEHPA